jgi:FkbM family methyltransferase
MNSSVAHFAREIGPARFFRRTLLWQVRKRILRRAYVMRMPTGGTIMLPPTTSGSAIYITSCDIDWGGERTLASLLSADGIFIDAGAHIGYYALYMAPRVREVWAFEPDPEILPVLRANCARCRNVRVIPKALSNVARLLPFLVGQGGTSRFTAEGTDRAIQVEATTLDGEWQAAGRPTVTALKVDVEGHDLDVLLGAEQVVRTNQALVFTEMNNRTRLPELWRWLDALQYQAWAYTRSRPGDPEIFLSRFGTAQAAQERYWTMIFLVPQRLATTFESLGSSSRPAHE